jgi:hypothetical protein
MTKLTITNAINNKLYQIFYKSVISNSTIVLEPNQMSGKFFNMALATYHFVIVLFHIILIEYMGKWHIKN